MAHWILSCKQCKGPKTGASPGSLYCSDECRNTRKANEKASLLEEREKEYAKATRTRPFSERLALGLVTRDGTPTGLTFTPVLDGSRSVLGPVQDYNAQGNAVLASDSTDGRARGNRRCGKCGDKGHNSRTCSKDIAKSDWHRQEVVYVPKGNRKCGTCGGSGHNARTCKEKK